jgi:CRP-like cAMP-binding protein
MLCGIRRRTTDRRARFALLESLPTEDAARVVALGQPRRIATGKTVIEEWDTSQDFFLIREGSVEVLVDGVRIARLGPDEFFGEIAALDWGAGFSYPRIAQVVAAEPLEVLVYPHGGLLKLFDEVPGVEQIIRSAVESRLAAR